MILRVVFFILMAGGLLGFGTVAWILTRPPPLPPAAEPVAKLVVLIAAKPLRAGSLLRPEDLTGKEMTEAEAGNDHSADTQDTRRAMSGAMVRRSLGPGDVVRSADVMHPGDHGFLAAVLQPGMRAITVGVDAITGTAGLIWPGDRVDLILTASLQEGSLPMGRRVAAETVLSDVRVIAIDQQLVQGATPGGADSQARTATLEVTPDEAQRVSVAIRLGRLSLSVRSAEPAPPGGAHGPTATTWAGDVSQALSEDTAPARQKTITVYQGAADGKEFKF